MSYFPRRVKTRCLVSAAGMFALLLTFAVLVVPVQAKGPGKHRAANRHPDVSHRSPHRFVNFQEDERRPGRGGPRDPERREIARERGPAGPAERLERLEMKLDQLLREIRELREQLRARTGPPGIGPLERRIPRPDLGRHGPFWRPPIAGRGPRRPNGPPSGPPLRERDERRPEAQARPERPPSPEADRPRPESRRHVEPPRERPFDRPGPRPEGAPREEGQRGPQSDRLLPPRERPDADQPRERQLDRPGPRPEGPPRRDADRDPDVRRPDAPPARRGPRPEGAPPRDADRDPDVRRPDSPPQRPDADRPRDRDERRTESDQPPV